MAEDDAIVRLARQIEAAQRAERFRAGDGEIAKVRVQGACELHRVCADFVSSVNSNLSETLLAISPESYSPDAFREAGANLIQISSQGRQMQISFEVPKQMVSTEKFPIPYVLEGEVRAYNQEMLERFEIHTRMIFFCVENETTAWRHFDWRTRSTGLIDRELLASLMEPLF